MRMSPAIGMSLLVLFMGTSGVLGSEFKRQTSSSQASAQPSLLSEFRFGFSAQDPWGPEGQDGSANLTGEILFAKPFTASDLFTSYFIPRPHVGGSLNFDGRTSFAYAGLSWTVDVTPDIFVEGSVGGAFHNGKDQPLAHRQELGCSPLFRESGSVGVRLSANWSVMATVEHLSNGGLCSDENRGLTNVGARVGYSF
jgi:hypothetical protein